MNFRVLGLCWLHNQADYQEGVSTTKVLIRELSANVPICKESSASIPIVARQCKK